MRYQKNRFLTETLEFYSRVYYNYSVYVCPLKEEEKTAMALELMYITNSPKIAKISLGILLTVSGVITIIKVIRSYIREKNEKNCKKDFTK